MPLRPLVGLGPRETAHRVRMGLVARDIARRKGLDWRDTNRRRDLHQTAVRGARHHDLASMIAHFQAMLLWPHCCPPRLSSRRLLKASSFNVGDRGSRRLRVGSNFPATASEGGHLRSCSSTSAALSPPCLQTVWTIAAFVKVSKAGRTFRVEGDYLLVRWKTRDEKFRDRTDSPVGIPCAVAAMMASFLPVLLQPGHHSIVPRQRWTAGRGVANADHAEKLIHVAKSPLRGAWEGIVACCFLSTEQPWTSP